MLSCLSQRDWNQKIAFIVWKLVWTIYQTDQARRENNFFLFLHSMGGAVQEPSVLQTISFGAFLVFTMYPLLHLYHAFCPNLYTC